MSIFNRNSRTKNVMRVSSVGLVSNLIKTLAGFVYRSLFLYYLSSEYLGINGLFTNILSILSFAELGFGTVMAFRFYAPIANDDVHKVGQLMRFMKRMYAIVAIVILCLGLSLLPFLDVFIKEGSVVPEDVDLEKIYLMFLLQTLSTYIFAYKKTLLSADQRQYILIIFTTVLNLSKYVFQFAVLAFSGSYMLTLATGITTSLVYNYLISLWITRRYKEVFEVRDMPSKEERKEIFKDTYSNLFHKIGGTVLTSTDNMLISRFVGLAATGLYSNYSMVLSGVNSILSSILGGFTATLGNANIKQQGESKYVSFRRLLFANFWIAGTVSVCLYVLIDDFVRAWVGAGMVLSGDTVFAICVQFYFSTTRSIAISYSSGSGLFVKDRARPLIEAAVNLVVSIYLANRIGLAGVFWGTVASHLCTVFWREPLLLFRHVFHRSMKEYWMLYGAFALLTFGTGALLSRMEFGFAAHGLLLWCAKALIVFALVNLVFILAFFRNKDFQFYAALIRKAFGRFSGKKGRGEKV